MEFKDSKSKILSLLPDNIDFSKEFIKDNSTTVTELSKPSSIVTDLSRPSTGYTSLSENSPDLSKDMFTPTTYDALEYEIRRNSFNINSIDESIYDETIRDSVKENLMDERRYLL